MQAGQRSGTTVSLRTACKKYLLAWKGDKLTATAPVTTVAKTSKLRTFFEDALPLIIAALGGVESYYQSNPADLAYAAILAIIIKTLTSLLAGSS